MKKKSDKKRKTKKGVAKEESDLENLLDEEKIKELAEEIKEEDFEEGFSDEDISEFINLSGSTAPVLEQIAGAQQLGRIFFTPGGAETGEEGKEIKYNSSKYNESSEKNYETKRDENAQEITVRQPEHFETGIRRGEEMRSVTSANTELQELRKNQGKTEKDYFTTPERAEEKRSFPFESQPGKKREYKL